MNSICFATNNKNKLAEITGKIGHLFTIVSLQDIGCMEELAEDQDTIEGNSDQKASYVNSTYQVNCFADDTGLLVHALNGAPGVYSARYAGPGCTADDNITKLLSEMKDRSDRSASFLTCITLYVNGKKSVFTGEIKGRIATERHGSKGFGYDPVFIPDGYAVSFAEMSMEEKNIISHRALAVDKLVAYLKSL